MKRTLLALTAVILAVASWPAFAAQNFDLYSWKSGNNWSFALVRSPSQAMAAAEIRQSGPLLGTSKVKEHLLAMADGDSVTWMQRSDTPFQLPPEEVVQELKDYAKTVGVKFTLAPTGKP